VNSIRGKGRTLGGEERKSSSDKKLAISPYASRAAEKRRKLSKGHVGGASGMVGRIESQMRVAMIFWLGKGQGKGKRKRWEERHRLATRVFMLRGMDFIGTENLTTSKPREEGSRIAREKGREGPSKEENCARVMRLCVGEEFAYSELKCRDAI